MPHPPWAVSLFFQELNPDGSIDLEQMLGVEASTHTTLIPEIIIVIPKDPPPQVSKVHNQSSGLMIEWKDWTRPDYIQYYTGQPTLTGQIDPFSIHIKDNSFPIHEGSMPQYT